MYLSSQTFLFVSIFISISWNIYNTYQYRLLVDRQSKLENLLTEFLPQLQSQSTMDEAWLSIIEKENVSISK